MNDRVERVWKAVWNDGFESGAIVGAVGATALSFCVAVLAARQPIGIALALWTVPILATMVGAKRVIQQLNKEDAREDVNHNNGGSDGT